jgi:uncharacterized membrane protein YsdA (DUF1294 family)
MRNSKRTPHRRQSPQTTYGLAALIILLVLGFFVYQWLRLDLYWVWLVVLNFVTFVFYRFDKRQAAVGATRVPEVVLLALLMTGGVLGGAAGMLMRPHHKTHKPLFWIMLLAATALHGYLIYRWMLV